MVRFDLKIFLDNTGMRAGDQWNFICLFKAFQMEIMDYGTCILRSHNQRVSCMWEYFLMPDSDGELRLDIFTKKVYKD
jgi:hypothetical protein